MSVKTYGFFYLFALLSGIEIAEKDKLV